MKKLAAIMLIAAILTAVFSLSACTEADGPKLLFEDNFDTLDLTKWRIETFSDGMRRGAYYREENVLIEDGNLVLRIAYDAAGSYGPGWYAGWVETSRIVTDNSEGYNGFSCIHGYFEARLKVDYVWGAWSAFWLQPDDLITFSAEDIQDTGTDGAEIDIMESLNSYGTNVHVVHYDGYDSRLKSVRSDPVLIKNMYSEFHTYGVEWTETGYSFYVDGVLTGEITEMGGSGVLQYIILSNEVGGYFDESGIYPGVDQEGNDFWFGNIEKTGNKQANYDFTVDYVRVYDRKP